MREDRERELEKSQRQTFDKDMLSKKEINRFQQSTDSHLDSNSDTWVKVSHFS
jgi:hypothetical protein